MTPDSFGATIQLRSWDLLLLPRWTCTGRPHPNTNPMSKPPSTAKCQEASAASCMLILGTVAAQVVSNDGANFKVCICVDKAACFDN